LLFVLPGSGWAAYKDVVTLDQGWDEAARDLFYHSPQGSPILPYDWFLVLQQPGAPGLFRDNGYLESFGLIPWGRSKRNPDGLPIGLTIDKGLTGPEKKLGMNCGACHVTEIVVADRTVLVDGGVSHFDFWSFMAALLESLRNTHDDDAVFERFADRLLGAKADAGQLKGLRARLRGVVQKRANWAIRNAADVVPGPGRVDALNVILNQVTAQMINRPDNARPSNAPVSYPYLWDAPYLDFVQYNGVVPNAGAGAIGRNVGQVLGVFGEVSIVESILPPGYASSVRVGHRIDLERALETLISPSWSDLAAKKLLPALDRKLVSRGAKIYARQCAACHVEINPRKRGELASIPVKLIPLKVIGTDPAATVDFVKREIATGPLEGRKTAFIAGAPLCQRTHANQLLAHMSVAVMMHDLGVVARPPASALAGTAWKSFTGALHSLGESLGLTSSAHRKVQETDQHLIARMAAAGSSKAEITKALEARSTNKAALFEMLVEDGTNRPGEDAACLEVLQTVQYRARPLNGIWSTGPFLHNGSVPNLTSLLAPPENRPVTFNTGSPRIDVEKVGFMDVAGPNTMNFDTRKPGNSNAGHLFGVRLEPADKSALLEYLKSL
jgi:hypothetical protein